MTPVHHYDFASICPIFYIRTQSAKYFYAIVHPFSSFKLNVGPQEASLLVSVFFFLFRKTFDMSRFFATRSDSESDSSSEEEQLQRAPTAAYTVCILLFSLLKGRFNIFFLSQFLKPYGTVSYATM